MSLYLRRCKALIILLILLAIPLACAHAPSNPASTEPDLSENIDRFVAELTGDGAVFEGKKFAFADLTDSSGQKTQLTSYLEERIIERLAKTNKIHLVERGRLDALMSELKFNASGYIEDRYEKAVGRMLGADGLITGTMTDLGESYDLIVRLIKTETGEIMSVAQIEIPKDKKIQGLQEKILEKAQANFRPPLGLQMNLIAQRKKAQGVWEEVIVEDGGILRSGDNLQIHFKANADCFLYVLLLDSQGRVSLLFPDQRIKMANQVRADQDYTIPPGDLWFFLDDKTGQETIYLLASYAPMSQLDKLLSEIVWVAEAGEKELSGQIKEEIKTLYRGMDPIKRPKPPRPIEITGYRLIGRVALQLWHNLSKCDLIRMQAISTKIY
ncbi:MAG: DUF4384 domain-containing protein [Nitrospirae bacterium]|nr:DUF4384 domain-containing protein [Nitrospirota bacterium]